MKHISDYLNEALKEIFEERAAIREFDGGYTREEAERLAMEEVTKRRATIDADKVQK